MAGVDDSGWSESTLASGTLQQRVNKQTAIYDSVTYSQSKSAESAVTLDSSLDDDCLTALADDENFTKPNAVLQYIFFFCFFLFYTIKNNELNSNSLFHTTKNCTS